MLSIVIPMAGRGSRFKDAGFEMPKPFIDINGITMVEKVRQNLPKADQLSLCILREHLPLVAPWVEQIEDLYTEGVDMIVFDGVTEGAACTILKTAQCVNPESELLVANSDQWLDWNPELFVDTMRQKEYDGGIPIFNTSDPKWSFAAISEEHGHITQVAEKVPISNNATCGIYWWRKAEDCHWSIEAMIAENDRVNNEFYLAPSFNYLIAIGHKIAPYGIMNMVGMGTPEDLNGALELGWLK